MASNLAGDICLGQFNACLFRVALLDDDCTPIGGTDSGIVTPGIVSLTATPDVEEGTVFEPKTGCGSIAWTYEEPDRVKRYNLSGQFIYIDFEMDQMLFGGSLVTGRGGGPFSGEVIGHAEPNFRDTPAPNVYLEVITQTSGAGVGDCVTSGAAFPTHIGYIFGKVRMTPGEKTFENGEYTVNLTGKATNNPNLFDGPWNDYPGAGYIPNSPLIKVGYSREEYEAIEAVARCGFQTLPAGS